MSDQINDGGPAFPALMTDRGWLEERGGVNVIVQPHDGMSLRDYFAAHAPQEIPPWFRSQWFKRNWKPTAKRPDSMDAGLNLHNPRVRESIREWWAAFHKTNCDLKAYKLHHAGETESEKQFLDKWEREFTQYAEDTENDRLRHDAACYFAWRYHYADAMLAARKEAPCE